MTIPVFTAGTVLTAAELNAALTDAGALPMTQANTWSEPQTFNAPIIQTPGQGANNSSSFAQYGDLFSDALLSGGVLAVPSPASLSATLPLGTAAVLGQRVPFPATPFSVTASSTSYLDLSNTGVLTVSTSATVTANSLRLWEAISAAILSPAPSLAASTAAGTLALGTYDYELVAHDATGYGLPGTAVSTALALTAPTPTLAASTAAGTLVAGTYTYGLVAHTATGYSLLGTTDAITTTATGEVVLTWVFPPDVTSVDVYGRVAGSLGLLASGITATTWTDDGSVTVGAAAPTTATATGEVVVTWANPLNETSMDIYGRISGSIGLLASGVTGTTWTDTGTATVGAAPPTVTTSNAIQIINPRARIGYDSLMLNILDFGADPTGATASDAAFILANKYLARIQQVLPVYINAYTQGIKIILPPGTYLLTEPSSFLNSDLFYHDEFGVEFEASGPVGSVGIVYNPATVGPLINNQNAFLFLRFNKIVFYGENSSCDIIDSYSTGQAQDYAFFDCLFSGSWNYGVNLTGSNTNSEWKWDRCAFTGAWSSFLYVGDTNTSDQFLNYWFIHCKYDTSYPWITMYHGGSIRLVDCDVSGYSPSSQTYIFNLLNVVHDDGVQSFKASGVRFEQKTQYAGIMNCEWGGGIVKFDTCDFSSAAFNSFAPTVLSACFNPGNSAGPSIHFDTCSIMGQHQYISGVGINPSAAAIKYSCCIFDNHAYPEDAFIFTPTNGEYGQLSVVNLDRCKGSGSQLSYVVGEYLDASLNWQNSLSGTTARRVISVRDIRSNLPSATTGSITVGLPLNALITRVSFILPNGCSTSASTTAGFTVQTGETTPTVLASILLNNPDYAAGGTLIKEIAFPCSTREKATITLVPNSGNDQEAAHSYCLIEYIG